MDVQCRKDGVLVVSLDLHEAIVFQALPGRLREVLKNPGLNDRVSRRLFPPAYSDVEKDREYRRLLGDDLVRRKLEGVDAFEKSIREMKMRQRRVEILVAPGDFDLWLAFVNDMRILLGTELDIRDDNWGDEFDPAHPHAEDLALLHYLSWLEEELLGAGGFEKPHVDPDDIR